MDDNVIAVRGKLGEKTNRQEAGGKQVSGLVGGQVWQVGKRQVGLNRDGKID